MQSNQWFLSFFVNYLPTETVPPAVRAQQLRPVQVLRVWDLFFIDGRLALFRCRAQSAQLVLRVACYRVALAIFLMAKDEVLQCTSPESMIACINKVSR